MSEPASDELIAVTEKVALVGLCDGLRDIDERVIALIARIREQDAVMDQMKGTIDDLLAARKEDAA